ncbi:MAG: LytTR family DNA-binding domain-containing protein [Lachnospiraceae bacterium]|nr:LytTR family DNA-binding domain-containing protein [Lachnospiraceae bacterium]
MIRVAVVEDEQSDINNLSALLERYGKERSEHIEVFPFKNAINFLNGYQPNYDLIFMDIQMPHMDGMDAASKLRQIDSDTLLIFVTNMANVAVNGYEVGAFDFIVKPAEYASLKLKMDRVVENLSLQSDKKIIITSDGAKILFQSKEIQYVEVLDHKLIYHTIRGDYSTYGTMSKAAAELKDSGFTFCNKSFLVNMKYVTKVEKYTVTVGNAQLQISHPRKKGFMEELSAYIGGTL